ncbi:hypothetical protein PROFUN_13835 [Planoprotostelium fungivorum]|uniref:Plasma membrane proteolipid 3 n=1 Tax=Planoprotostelium fungivorum TaxID=1890364 RepID=A0A2P6N2X8_9EUKA|nr:hypothetical protein PROFUN_13835 [Planoprotostelium fungivorum]
MPTVTDVFLFLISLILPPLAVLIMDGCRWMFVLNIILCIFGWFPGIVHALILCIGGWHSDSALIEHRRY